MRSLLLAAAVLLPTLVAAGGCHTFYSDLCRGPYSCMCTKYEPCGTENRSNAMTASGGCAGSCRTVIHDQCTGPDSCMKDSGPCEGLPTPQPATAATRYGVDFAGTFSSETIDCLAQNNISFGVVRAHHSDGGTDPAAPPMIKKMRAAGFSTVDAYLFPCTTFNYGHTAADQVKNTVNFLKDNGATPDRIWFDTEWNPDSQCDWSSSNLTYNCQFITELVAEAANHNIPFGFYAGHSFWEEYLPGCDAGKDLPLWYALYDGVQSFQDWVPYGGWTKPVAKQYNDQINVCGVGTGMDANWAPNGFN